MTGKKIIVKGMVQGVGWRYYCLKIAERFDIKGYVKNKNDGSVKIVVEGTEDGVEAFIEYLKSSNYPGHVRSWEIKEISCKGDYKDFRIKY
jgi:acylphosphatase